MHYRYGFELEGFYLDGDGAGAAITVPPKDFPTDGFPGLVELRTTGAKALDDAFAQLFSLRVRYPNIDICTARHTFTATERGVLRRRHELKQAWDIRNIYGRSPRLLSNATIASFQINISNQTRASYTDDKGVVHPAQYGLLDVGRIVRALDHEFEDIIRLARRQPGEYCIKDDRLEYRSLPNQACTFTPSNANRLLAKIRRAVEEK